MPKVINPNAVANSLPGRLKQTARNLRELAGASHSTIYSMVVGLGGLVVNGASQLLGGLTVTGVISGSSDIDAGGNVNGSTGTFSTGVNSVGVYNNLVSSGSYKVQYINVSGAMGYVPSSKQFKQDITPAPNVADAMLAIQIVTFRYKQAVADLGDAAAIEWGVIAEDIHDLGLTWLVDYDENDQPLGVKYERLALALIPVIQDHEARLKAAGL